MIDADTDLYNMMAYVGKRAKCIGEDMDWDAFLVWADMHEEGGYDSQARAIRWMHANHKHPYPCAESGRFAWFWVPDDLDPKKPPQRYNSNAHSYSDLPKSLWRLLKGGSIGNRGASLQCEYYHYDDFALAVEAFLAAFAKWEKAEEEDHE